MAPVAPLAQFILLNGSKMQAKKVNVPSGFVLYLYFIVFYVECVCVFGDMCTVLGIIYIILGVCMQYACMYGRCVCVCDVE